MAKGGPCHVGHAPPPSPLLHHAETPLRSSWILDRTVFVVVDIQPIVDPFHDVAAHVQGANPAGALGEAPHGEASLAVDDVGLGGIPVVAPWIDQ